MTSLVLLPLVLVLPGYAIAAALFPPGSIPAAERAVYALSLSFAATALAGVLAQLVHGLDRTTWAVTLSLLIVAAGAVALARRRRSPGGLAPPRVVLPRVDPPRTAAFVAALALSAAAIAIASNGAREEHDDVRFAELWAVPRAAGDAADGTARTVSIGVSNHEGGRAAFRVRVTHGGALLAEWDVRLGDGGRWERSLPAPAISPAEPLLVTMLVDGEVRRRTYLRSESS